MNMHYSINIEVYPNGVVEANAPDLPGCSAYGSSEDECLFRMRLAVPDYFRWLSYQDSETPTMSSEVELSVAEKIADTTVNGTVATAFFSTDAQPVSQDDIDWSVALSSYALQDIGKQVQKQTDDILNWRPSPNEPSVNELLDSLAQLDLQLLSLMSANQRPGLESLPGPTFERLYSIHEECLLLTHNSAPDIREKIIEVNGERWSLRKMIRRELAAFRSTNEKIALTLAQRV